MSPDESQPIRSRSGHRRTVKIVKQRSPSRAAIVSLALVGTAAVAIPITWTLVREDPQPPPQERDLTDALLDWRCDAGHTFAAPGRTGRRICQHCDQMASPFTSYSCPVHGDKEIEVLFVRDEDGSPRISKQRLVGRTWVSVEQQLRCPQCDRPLAYDPIKSLHHKIRQRGSDSD